MGIVVTDKKQDGNTNKLEGLGGMVLRNTKLLEILYDNILERTRELSPRVTTRIICHSIPQNI